MKTNRLRLRRPNSSDEDFFFQLENDLEVFRFLPPGRPFDRNKVRLHLQQYIDKKGLYRPFGFWVAERKDDKERVGYGLLLNFGGDEYRLGYVISKKFWGLGYATEISERLISFGFENKLKRIHAVTSPENSASQKVLKKLGFSFNHVVPGETPEILLNLYSLEDSKL